MIIEEMTTYEKLEWVRNNWSRLKVNNKLRIALERIKSKDKSLDPYTIQDIIDIEESLPMYLK